jgi:branched-chain amino acid transport system permease protein
MKTLSFFFLAAGVATALAAIGWAVPTLVFLMAIAVSKGLVVLGLVMLMRAGLVSFGQGLYFAIGGYAVGLLSHVWKINDAAILIGVAIVAAVLVSLGVGVLIARYRDIFFAMLTLALSMILYGLLVKSAAFGGTDGFNVKNITLLGLPMTGASRFTGLVLVLGFAVLAVTFVRFYALTAYGRLAAGVKENEIRVEYLGANANSVVHSAYVGAAVLAAIGGALTGIMVGHVDPEMAFWATSGEFVVIAVLGGSASVFTPFLAAIILEFVRSYAYQYAPNTWQLVLGSIIFAMILFLPEGLADLGKRRRTALAKVG